MQKGIATLMNGAVGVDIESKMLFCETPRIVEILAAGTKKRNRRKNQALMQQVKLLRERAADNLQGNRVD